MASQKIADKDNKQLYDIAIIGGGPAAVAAAVYAARKKLKTLVITKNFQNQSSSSQRIENWIGETSISGLEFSQKLKEHLLSYKDIMVKEFEEATRIKKEKDIYLIETNKNNHYETKTIVAATGASHRLLGVPGEKELIGRGVAFCSICDAPFYKEKTVAVVGGGNSGLEAVLDLSVYAKKIYLLIRKEELMGDPITQEKISELSQEKFEIIYSADTKEILGKEKVTAIKYENMKTGEVKELAVDGVFVEIGSMPNSGLLKGLVDINEFGEIVVDHRTGLSSDPGIGAAGDVTDDQYKQNNIAAAGGARAALSLYGMVLGVSKSTPCADGEECR